MGRTRGQEVGMEHIQRAEQAALTSARDPQDIARSLRLRERSTGSRRHGSAG